MLDILKLKPGVCRHTTSFSVNAPFPLKPKTLLTFPNLNVNHLKSSEKTFLVILSRKVRPRKMTTRYIIINNSRLSLWPSMYKMFVITPYALSTLIQIWQEGVIFLNVFLFPTALIGLRPRIGIPNVSHFVRILVDK